MLDYETDFYGTIKGQAKERYNALVAAENARIARENKIRQVKLKYKLDKEKLAKLLLIDDGIISEAKKND